MILYHLFTTSHQLGEVVKREEMMLVLERLESLRIKATDYTNPLTVTLAGVSMTTTDYDAERESGETIPTVEICTCPPGKQTTAIAFLLYGVQELLL